MPKRSDLKLTKRTVDALEVDRKDAVFWDRELAGFGVRVHATGRKTYVVQSRGPGGPKRVTLGRHGELAVEEARKRAACLIDRIKRGEDLSAAAPEAETHRGGTRRALHAHPRGETPETRQRLRVPHRARQAHPAVPGRDGTGRGRRGGSHGASSRPSRYAGPGEPGGPPALADVHARRGVGAGTRPGGTPAGPFAATGRASASDF